jgi:carboxylesterase
MPRYAHLDPQGFAHAGDGDVGALLLHGLTGAPTEMRLLADHLHARGVTVHAPLLPGHGTHHDELHATPRGAWVDAAKAALAALRAEVRTVFVVGQSMGALVAVRVVVDDSAGVAGVVLLAPALSVSPLAQLTRLPLPLRHLPKFEERAPDLVDVRQLRHVWSYTHTPLRAVAQVLALQREVQSDLPRLTAPLLVMQGRKDKTVRPVSATRVIDAARSADKELVWLEQSGHIVAVDGEHDVVSARTAAFIERCRSTPRV